jgi:hypothetical protein
MAHCPRAAISGRGSQCYQAWFGHSTLVSWQLIVENAPTGRFASRPQGDVTSSRMVLPADNRKAWMGNKWAAAHKRMLAQGAALHRWQRRFPANRCFSERRREVSSEGANIRTDRYSSRCISIHSRRRRSTRSSIRLARPARRDVGPSRSGRGGTFNKLQRSCQGHSLHGRRISASADVAAAKRLRGRFAETRLVVAGKPSEMAKLKCVCDGGDRRRTLSATG